jgi:hypothetical protein
MGLVGAVAVDSAFGRLIALSIIILVLDFIQRDTPALQSRYSGV